MSKRREDDSFSSSSSGSDYSEDTDAYFWGCTLTRDKPIARWAEKMDDSKDSAFHQEHRLGLRQAVLGVGAVEGERNVVAVDSENCNMKKVEFPILSLTLNQKDMCTMNMDFVWPVVFRLSQGSGPVILTGEHHVNYPGDEQDEYESESSSSSSDDSLKKKKKKAKKKDTSPRVAPSRQSTSSTKDSSKRHVRKTSRSESSDKPDRRLKPLKSESKARTSKETGSKKGTAKKKKVTEEKKVAKKVKKRQVKVKDEPD